MQKLTQKNQKSFYDKCTEIKIRETVLFTSDSNNIKYFGVFLKKLVKYLYDKYFKSLKKKLIS